MKIIPNLSWVQCCDYRRPSGARGWLDKEGTAAVGNLSQKELQLKINVFWHICD